MTDNAGKAYTKGFIKGLEDLTDFESGEYEDVFVEADRNEFEQTIFQNEVELLENIISNIKFKE